MCMYPPEELLQNMKKYEKKLNIKYISIVCVCLYN